MTSADVSNPSSPTTWEPRAHPAVRNYTLFSLAALFLLVVCLANRGLDWLCLVPALIGCFTLLTHLRHGPPLVLLSLVGLLGYYAPRPRGNYAGWARHQTIGAMDLVLCIAVLGYVLGHYRLISLIGSIFPTDPRQRPIDPSQQRSPALVKRWEMALLGLSLPVWTGFALTIWVLEMMDFAPPPAGQLEPAPVLILLQELGLVWGCLLMIATLGTAVSYLRWTTASPEESLLYLQDQCWRTTRHEQSILNRWLMWVRLRAQRRKEPS